MRVDRRSAHRGRLRHDGKDGGQLEPKRAAALVAIEIEDTAAMLLHHSVADAQAEPRAFPDGD